MKEREEKEWREERKSLSFRERKSFCVREGYKVRQKKIKRVGHCKRVLPRERGREFLTDYELREQQDKSNRMKKILAF